MKLNPVMAIGALGCALVAATVGLASDAGARGSAAAPPHCQSGQLRPHFERFDGAMGHYYDTWQLINTGPRCETRGWVGGLNFGPDGRPLRTSITRTAGPSTTVVLARGQHASWTFGYDDPGVLNCRPENAAAMIITPPDNINPVLASRGESACRGVINYESPLAHGG